MNNLEINEEQIKRRRRANIASLINDYDDIEYEEDDEDDKLIWENNQY